MNQKIKDKVISMGADVCGIGAIERFHEAPKGFGPIDIYPDCKSVISFGIALPGGLFQVNPRIVYGYFNSQLHYKVDEIALTASKWMEEEYICKCVPIPSDSPNDYWDAQNLTAKGIMSMKHAAVACGLGGMGKSSLFLNPKYGNRLILGVILTDLELQSDPIGENICISNCKKCIDSCPVHAIQNGSVEQKLCRVNAYGKTARGFDTVECNLCRRICPMINGRSGVNR